MSASLKPWGPWGRAILELIVRDYAEMPEDRDEALTRIGSKFDLVEPWYIRIDEVDGRSSQLAGVFVFDIEVFAPAGSDVARSVSDDLEALLLGYPFVVEVDDETFVFDTVTQNSRARFLPWEDEETDRLGATYVITARRR
jgi:hypothetical protein